MQINGLPRFRYRSITLAVPKYHGQRRQIIENLEALSVPKYHALKRYSTRVLHTSAPPYTSTTRVFLYSMSAAANSSG